MVKGQLKLFIPNPHRETLAKAYSLVFFVRQTLRETNGKVFKEFAVICAGKRQIERKYGCPFFNRLTIEKILNRFGGNFLGLYYWV